ncbi:nucleotidyltransferase [Candidatus Riflebacteria bacterium]
MNTQPDFEELLRLLEENQVDYMIVGGYAVVFYGFLRMTKDIDIFYNSDKENIKKLKQALVHFGFNEKDLPATHFSTEGNVITFGVVPVRIDLLNTIDGVRYEVARENIVRGQYGKIEVNFIGLKDLKQNKASTNRLKDKLDLEELP